jgi:hypothetical protein
MGIFEHEELSVQNAHPITAAGANSFSIYGVVVGELVGFCADGMPLVIFPHQIGSAAVCARSVVELFAAHIGTAIVLQFEQGDPTRPLVMGIIQSGVKSFQQAAPAQVEVDVDGKRLTVSAKKELVLKCGQASIRLTQEGKIYIRGEYISSQANGMHRVKGGSVQIN